MPEAYFHLSDLSALWSGAYPTRRLRVLATGASEARKLSAMNKAAKRFLAARSLQRFDWTI